MKSDTPETDARAGIDNHQGTGGCVSAEFARKMERQLNTLHAAIRNMRDVEGRYHTENACRALYALIPVENVKVEARHDES